MILIRQLQFFKALLHLFHGRSPHLSGIQLHRFIINVQRLFVTVHFQIAPDQACLPVLKGIDRCRPGIEQQTILIVSFSQVFLFQFPDRLQVQFLVIIALMVKPRIRQVGRKQFSRIQLIRPAKKLNPFYPPPVHFLGLLHRLFKQPGVQFQRNAALETAHAVVDRHIFPIWKPAGDQLFFQAVDQVVQVFITVCHILFFIPSIQVIDQFAFGYPVFQRQQKHLQKTNGFGTSHLVKDNGIFPVVHGKSPKHPYPQHF